MSTYRSAGMLQPAHGTKGHTLVIRYISHQDQQDRRYSTPCPNCQ